MMNRIVTRAEENWMPTVITRTIRQAHGPINSRSFESIKEPSWFVRDGSPYFYTMNYLQQVAAQDKEAKAAKESQEISDRAVETEEVTSLIIRDILVKFGRVFLGVFR